MDISVILCTWNNYDRLSITLEAFLSVESSDKFSWELIVVDNNSTDNTSNVIHTFLHRLPLVHVFEPMQGLSFARNSGLNVAKGQLIIFTDDDVKPCTEWLKEYWCAYKSNSEFAFWGGPVESDFESTNVNHKLIQLAPPSVKGLYLGDELRYLNKNEYFISANWALTSVAIKSIGKFDVNMGLNPSLNKVSIGEETDLMDRLKKIGYKAIYLPNAKLSHYVPKDKSTLKHIASRSKAWGYYRSENELFQYKRKLFGVPFWFYKNIFKKIFKFVLSLLRGKLDYRTYLEIHRIYGQIESIRKK